MIRRPPRSTLSSSSAASDVYKRQGGSQHAAYTVGALTALGGAAGFYKAQSKASLVMGMSVGALMCFSGYLIGQDDFKGHTLAAGTSAVLAAGMGHEQSVPASSCPVVLWPLLECCLLLTRARRLGSGGTTRRPPERAFEPLDIVICQTYGSNRCS
eukprot:TRINITY_DN6560_c0_g1_i1.p1 TRINITY_DN6560_c0_g1~~TRINITY_DN6560_c0_g1_i1.p1  ORF type:complete len:156 (-),score=22.03 TRINITY_DN6560_c0_g1_i1:219-686(-)